MELAIDSRFEALLKAREYCDGGGWPPLMHNLVTVWLEAVEAQDWQLAQRIAETALNWSKSFKLSGAKDLVQKVIVRLQESGQDLELYHLQSGSPLRGLADEPGGAFTDAR